MAATAAGARLTEAYRLSQSTLAAKTVTDSFTAWAALDPTDLDGTIVGWLQLMQTIVAQHRAASAALAGDYLTAYRAVELGTVKGFTVVAGAPLDPAALATSLTVTGPVRIKTAMGAGRLLADAIDTAKADAAAAASRHALDGGRATAMATVAGDKRCLGWARATSGDPCAFCAMLASRGPVYKAEDSAGFEAHDRCNCQAEPVYSAAADWPAGAQDYRSLWNDVAKGLPPDEALNAFRRAMDTSP